MFNYKGIEMKKIFYLAFISTLFLAFAGNKKEIKVSNDSITVGTSVNIRGNSFKLSKGQLKIGDNFFDKASAGGLIVNKNNRVTIVNFVPSIKTPVCERQSHLLGETKLSKEIDLMTISTDDTKSQKYFAKEAKLTNINFISAEKNKSFGDMTGLNVIKKGILTRGVVVLDKNGIVKYMQFVPELTTLPNMNKAFVFAENILKY